LHTSGSASLVGRSISSLPRIGRAPVATPRPGVVERVEELGPVPREQTMSEVEGQLVARIDARLATLNNPTVVLYVPGYRVTFDDVAVMMGSLSAYLGRGATVTLLVANGPEFLELSDGLPTC
jgi:hypothetical protein